MKKNVLTVWLMLAVPVFATTGRQPDAVVLLRSYYRYLITQQVGAQVQTLTAQLPERDGAEVQAAWSIWSGQRMEPVRQELTAQFGEQSRAHFEQFFTAYAEAENKGDPQFFHKLCDELGANQPYPANYMALRQMGLNAWLQPEIQASSKFLAEVQTWLNLKSRTPNMPSLAAWLARDLPTTKLPPHAPSNRQPTQRPPPPNVVQQLAGAEATLPEFKPEPETTSANPLDTFIAQRKERRDRVAKEAQDAMASVTAERQQAEQEAASKKQSEAQADAEAVKGQAQRLAQAENDAIEQEKNSWTTKLKGLVGSTITAAGGAFFGSVGSQAGQIAANMIFKDQAPLGIPPTATPTLPSSSSQTSTPTQ